jgi:hypothetical protein
MRKRLPVRKNQELMKGLRLLNLRAFAEQSAHLVLREGRSVKIWRGC